MIKVFKNKLRLVLLFFFTVLFSVGIAFTVETGENTAKAGLINNTANAYRLPLTGTQTIPLYVEFGFPPTEFSNETQVKVSDFNLELRIHSKKWGRTMGTDLDGKPPYFPFNDVYIFSNCSIDKFKLYHYNEAGEQVIDIEHTDTPDKTKGLYDSDKEGDLEDNVYYVEAYYKYTQDGIWINEFTTSFTLDTSAPTITLDRYAEDNYVISQRNITVSYDDNIGIASAKYSVNKDTGYYPSTGSTTDFTSGTIFREPGNYAVTVKDNVGHEVTKYFTIDRTAPIIKFSDTITSEGERKFIATNSPAKVYWDITQKGVSSALCNNHDTLSCYYTVTTELNEKPLNATIPYTANTELTDEGWYLFVLYDKAGNYTSFDVIYDKTAPTVKLTGVEKGGITSNNVYISFDGTYNYGTAIQNKYGAGLQCSYQYDFITSTYAISFDKTFPTTTKISGDYMTYSEEGNYLIEITDRAGNITPITFTIDRSAPTLTFENITTTKDDIIFSNEDKIRVLSSLSVSGVGGQFTNSSDTITVKYSISTTGSFPTTAETVLNISSGVANLTEVGNYLITVTDKAGNTTSYRLTIDRTAPTLTLNGGTLNGFTNNNVSLTWNNNLGINSDLTNPSDAFTCYYNVGSSNVYPTTANTTHTLYNKGSSLSSIGHYSVTLYDTAGNKTSYNFTIDKTAPVFTITPLKGEIINGQNREGFTISYSLSTSLGIEGQRTKSDDQLTIWYSFSTSDFPSFAETNITDVYTNTQFTDEGFYLIKLTDTAGNFTTQTIHINKQSPTFKVYSLSMTELNSSTFAYNQPIKVSFDSSLTATVNGQPYISETAIVEEGEYLLSLTDVLGNTTTQTLRIITKIPTQNFDALRTPNAKWWETTNTEGENYAFDDYETAYKIADARERALLIQKEWSNDTWDGGVAIAPEDLSSASQGLSYYIYKSYADKNVNHAYFSLSTLNASIEKYVTASIKVNYIPKTPPTEYEGEIVYRDIYFSKKSITFNKIDNCFIFVDGVEQSYPYTLTKTGKHTITETDIAGNTITYFVYIDTELPTVKVSNLNGNMTKELPYNIISYFTYGLILEIEDADEQSIIIVNGNHYVNTTVRLSEAGKYEVSTRDASGNTGTLTIYISLDEPTVTFKEKEVEEIINSFSITIGKGDNFNSLTNLEISRLNEGAGVWEKLTNDNSSPSVEINTGTFFYEFSVTGQYKIILIDIYGRVIEEDFSFVKGSPKGKIFTTGGTELFNNAYTNKNVYFTWEMPDCSAEITKNNEISLAYSKGTFITEEGEYCIYLYSNVDDVYNYYYFTIDKTAPQGTLMANNSSLVNGGTSRFPISLVWTEAGCTATINGQPYASGTEIAEEGKWTIILTDKAGNTNTYEFKVKTSPPTISARSGGKELNNYDVTRRDVTISWTEYNCVCLVNNVEYPQNSRFVVEGTYTVILTDAYGNSSKFYFTIDKTAPIGYFYINGGKTEYSGEKILTNGKVSFVWEEADATAILNTHNNYFANSILSADGNYSFVLSDKAGNTNTYELIIKQVPPKAVLYANNLAIPSGSITNGNVKLTWTETGCTATVNEVSYTNGQLIKDEGFYKFELLDKFGNVATFEITIDKTAPILNIYSLNTLIENGAVIKSDAYVSWSEENCSATVNGSLASNGYIISDEGEYIVILKDIAENETKISFIIDKTANIGTLISKGQILQDGAITQNSAYFTWSEKGCTATLNGESYSNGANIINEGNYIIILTDKAGNTYTISFTIDKTAPEGKLLFSSNNVNNVTAGEVAFTWSEKGCTATLNGQPYEKNTFISTEGELKFVLSDKAGNINSYSANIDKTAPNLLVKSASGDTLSSGSTTRFDFTVTWEELNCSATINGQSLTKGFKFSEAGNYKIVLSDNVGNSTTFEITIDKSVPFIDIISKDGKDFPYCSEGFSAIWFEETYVVLLNGQPYISGTEITAEGSYNVVAYNSVGNSISYDIIVDRTAPEGDFKLLDNSLITTNFAIKNVYFTWTEENLTATINGQPYFKNSTISKDGTYSIVLTDASGNSTEYEFTIAKAKPEIVFYSKTDEKIITSTKADAEDNVIVLTKKLNHTIYLNNEIYESEEPLAVGDYVFTVKDTYGNSATYYFTVKAPVEPIERESSNTLGKLFGGSKTGTILFVTSLGIIAVLFIAIPFFRVKILKFNPIKKKLK